MKHLILSASLLLPCVTANAVECVNPTKTYSGLALTKALTCLQNRVKTVLNAASSKGVVLFENHDIQLYSRGTSNESVYVNTSLIIKNKLSTAMVARLNDSSIFAVDTAKNSCTDFFVRGLYSYSDTTILPGAEYPFVIKERCLAYDDNGAYINALTGSMNLQFIIDLKKSGDTVFTPLPIYLKDIPLPQ